VLFRSVLDEHQLAYGDIEVVFTSAEEKGLVGARNLDFSRFRSKVAIVLDSSGSVGNIVVGAPTHVTYEMRVIGKAAHAGIEPEKGVSAIKAAAEIISSLPDGRIDHETTANVGMITGGTATNVVPREVFICGEVRSHNSGTLNATREQIFGLARKAASGLKVEITIDEHEEYRTFRLDPKEPFLRYVHSGFLKCGITPVFTITGGGSDASIFNESGIRAVNISNGMQKVHSSEEFILKQDLHDGCFVLLECITGLGKLKEQGPSADQQSGSGQPFTSAR